LAIALLIKRGKSMTDPYQPPKSELMDKQAMDGIDPDTLASRWSRLFAVMIDGVIGMILAIPFWILTGSWAYISSGQQLPLTFMLLGSIYGFTGFVLVHYYFLNKSGQTVGKRILSIKIVDLENNLTGANPLILKRYLPMSVVSLIPILGSVLMLIDALFIFRKDKRCVHDFIAGTRVVKS
jgi:uncharacterized RDD family membrane protein YckC